MKRRVLAFADDYGLPQLLRHLPPGQLVAAVAAGIRPHQHGALRGLAARAHVPLLVQPRRDEPGYARFLEQVRELAPDYFVVNSYSMRIQPDALDLADGRGINIHGALLPQYRGANPIQWALINDEPETGVTMHRLAAGIDEGDIISQRRVRIGFADTWRDVQAGIAEATESLLADKLVDVLEDRCSALPQDAAHARYHRRRRPEDGLIDWSRPARQVYNLIRALVKPHPGAFYEGPAGRVTVDEYLPMPEVLALKHRVAGIAGLEADGIRLTPAGPDAIAGWPGVDGAIVLVASAAETAQRLGLLALHGIDWAAGTARLESRYTQAGTRHPGISSLTGRLAEVCRAELGLSRIAGLP